MDLTVVLRSILLRRGIEFVEEHNAFQMTMCSGLRKWRCLLAVNGSDIMCCAQFPWKAGSATLQALNELNIGQSIGCFMVKDGRVVLRYSSEITDPLETEELVVSLIRRCGSEVCRCWDRIYSAAEV